MKIFNILFALIFLSFVYVQFNDPDPILWILIYGSMATVCGLAAFNKYYKMVYIILFVLFTGVGLTYLTSVMMWLQQDDLSMLFDEIAKMENLFVEESREFLGLMICNVVLVINFWYARKLSKA